jgi:hypothetical protein
MVMSVVLSLVLMGQGQQVVTQGGPPPKPVPKDAPATLPDTPQAKHVKAYIDAFNAGNEATFLKAQETLMSASTLARRPAAERAKMYNRLRGDFPTMKITRVAASAEQIRAVIPDRDGNDAIFSFEFETKAPYKIKGIGVDIGHIER